jgi:small subunit ribosomal protein S20
MPNIKSQKKRALTNVKKAAAITSEKSALKTAMKSVIKLISAQDKVGALNALNTLNSKLDKAVTSGIYHKNYAARQKARFAKAYNALEKSV